MGSTIFFDTIPASLRKPLTYAEFNLKLANQGLSANRLETVILAPKLAAGTQPAATPVQIFSNADAETYAGLGSIAAEMARHLLATNPYATLHLVLVDDPAGSNATATVVYSGTVTGAGSETVWGDDEKIEIATASTDTPTTIAAAMAAAINARPWLTFTAAAAAGTLTLTSRHKGLLNNQILINATGTTVGAARAVTQFSGGTLAHDPAAALTSIFTSGHDIVASAFNDTATLTAIRNSNDTVSNSIEIRGRRAWFGSNGSVGNATTLSSGQNGWLVHGALARYTQTKGARSAPWNIAAAMAAVDAFEEDPARPLNTLPLPTLAIPDRVDVLSRGEQEALLYAGVTPLEPGPGNLMQVVRAITTYTTSAAGAPDAALLDITTPKTLFYFRELVVNDQKIRFSREKFSKRVANAIKQRAYEIAKMLEDLEILQNVDDYKDQFVWEPDPQNVNRLKLKVPSPIVPGLHLIASRFDLYISPAKN